MTVGDDRVVWDIRSVEARGADNDLTGVRRAIFARAAGFGE